MEDSPTTVLYEIRRRKRLRNLRDVEVAAEAGDPGMLPLFVRALRHKKESVRRRAGEALQQFGEPGFQALLQALRSGKIRQRETAASLLGSWGDPRAVEPLQEAIRDAERERSAMPALGCVFAFMFIGPAIFVWLLAKMGIIALRDTSRLRISAVESLGRIGDLSAISQLARMARSRERNSALFQATCDTLLLILPATYHLTPAQASQLGPDAVLHLAALLTSENMALVHAALHTLRAVGDGRAITAVQRLQKDRRQATSTCTLAGEVLVVLRERAALEEARGTLLRGSSATPGAAPQELLRAAYSTPGDNVAPEQLLRAGQPPTEEQR